jgi:hypothetical protein
MSKSGIMKIVLVAVMVVAIAGCSGEGYESSSPVNLVVSHSENLHRIDLNGGARCNEQLGTFSFLATARNPDLTGNQLQVRIIRYRVSYQRTDGGTAVPAPYTTSVNFLVGPTGAIDEQAIQTFRAEAFNQAPFVALRTANGGRDPETGSNRIRMDVIVEFFGETLGGENVYATSRHAMEFCFNCQGCG